VRVSPDVYLIDDPPEPPMPSGWQTWQEGHHPPRWAVEIVSSDWKKDYLEGPAKYAQLGCRELVLFDPDVALGIARGLPPRAPLTLYRRGEDGLFVQVSTGSGPFFSAELDAWLHVRTEGRVARLRIALDAEGRQIVPTEGERAAAEAKRAAEEARGRADAERRVHELEERLRKLERS
jgi:hypothetical protein